MMDSLSHGEKQIIYAFINILIFAISFGLATGSFWAMIAIISGVPLLRFLVLEFVDEATKL